jgi:hypothetical protein
MKIEIVILSVSEEPEACEAHLSGWHYSYSTGTTSPRDPSLRYAPFRMTSIDY